MIKKLDCYALRGYGELVNVAFVKHRTVSNDEILIRDGKVSIEIPIESNIDDNNVKVFENRQQAIEAIERVHFR